MDKQKKIQSVNVPVENSFDLKTAITEITRTINELQKEVGKNESKTTMHVENIAKLQKFNGKCYLGNSIKCPLTDDNIKELIIKEQTIITELVNSITSNNLLLNDIYKKADILNTKLEQKSYIDIVQPEIDRYTQELDKLSAEVVDTEETLNTNLYNIDNEMTTNQGLLTKIEAAIYNMKLINEAKQNYNRKVNELKIIEDLVDAFGPGGMKSILLNRILKPLENTINEKLAVMTNNNYSINFRVDIEDFNIYIISNGVECKIYHLSSSERWRMGVILQHAINSLTNSKLLVVDDVDILDQSNRLFFWNFIIKISNNLVNSFFCLFCVHA